MGRKYDSTTAKEKLRILEYADKFGFRAAGRQFSVAESNIRYWKRQEAKLKQMPSGKRADRGRTAENPEMEEDLIKWVSERRDQGLAVSSTEVRLRASFLCRAKFPNAQFKASLNWCYRFMDRHHLSVRRRTTIAQRLPDDYEEKLLNFQKFVIDLRKKKDIHPCNIGNADQTPLTFDLPYDTTIAQKNSKSVSIRTTGNEKNRFTVMLCCLADGTKLPPYIIFKRKTMPKLKLSTDVIVRVHEKGWMCENTMKDWLKTVWSRRPNSRTRSALVLDSFRCHRSDYVKAMLKEDNTDLIIIPGGMTSILQPLDVGINKPMKTALRRRWNEWIGGDDHTYTASGKMRKPEMDEICQWVSDAWNGLDTDIIVRSFLKCSISNSLDGTEDDVLWQDENTRATTEGVDQQDDDIDVYYNDDNAFDAEAFFNDSDEEDFYGFE